MSGGFESLNVAPVWAAYMRLEVDPSPALELGLEAGPEACLVAESPDGLDVNGSGGPHLGFRGGEATRAVPP